MKEFKYKSICHCNMTATGKPLKCYSTRELVVGEVYDIYLGTYHFSDEYEVYKDDVYITSFILEDMHKGETDMHYLKYFYNKEQMVQIMRDNKLKELV